MEILATIIAGINGVLFGWIPRRRMVTPVEGDVVFRYDWINRKTTKLYTDTAYWYTPWLCRIATFTVVRDPCNYNQRTFTSTDMSTWAVNVAVEWNLCSPISAATQTDDIETFLEINVDNAVMMAMLDKSDVEIVEFIHSGSMANHVRSQLNNACSPIGYEATSVHVQDFYRTTGWRLDHSGKIATE